MPPGRDLLVFLLLMGYAPVIRNVNAALVRSAGTGGDGYLGNESGVNDSGEDVNVFCSSCCDADEGACCIMERRAYWWITSGREHHEGGMG